MEREPVSLLVVADAATVAAVRPALTDLGAEVVAGDGGDDTLALFEARRPLVVVAAATLEDGDCGALLAAIRDSAGARSPWIVVVGDEHGPARTAHDVAELKVDRFVPRPLVMSQLAEAVADGLAARPSRDTAPMPVAMPDDAGEPIEGVDAGADAPPSPLPLREPTLVLAPARGDAVEDELVVTERQLGTRGDETRWAELRPLRAIDESAGARLARSQPAMAFDVGDLDSPLDGPEAPAGEDTPAELEPATADTPAPVSADDDGGDSGNFARELRRKMSVMAQRLFRGGEAPSPPPVDLRPPHDHQTEIDLALLVDGPSRGQVADLDDAPPRPVERTPTSPGASGTGSTQARERRVAAGEIVRGTTDLASLLAVGFATGFSGALELEPDPAGGGLSRRIYFEAGRPVFASSNDPADRIGQLLVREGKVTAAQLTHGLAVVKESGRRTGEVLVDLGYLKRRELSPAVRRHLEDVIYALFGWSRGRFRWIPGDGASAERLRLSRHPAAVVLEGVRRKLGAADLDRLIAADARVEVTDRDRLAELMTTADLSPEERAAIAAMDGGRELAEAGRLAGIEPPGAQQLAWALLAFGVATVKRRPTAVVDGDDAEALVGATDLAIDRERVRARWSLVEDADYFALLGIRRDASGFEIKRAYEAARRDFARDAFAAELRRELGPQLDEIGRVLDEAFAVLRDERLRTQYAAHLVD